MAVFNPKILDASIRDVASYLSDNQKVDLLLYAMRSLPFKGRSRAVIENAIQSCLQVATLTPENIAKARILRARARTANGWHVQAHDDLQAALAAEPDNPEAKALLHQRSVTVEKLLAPLPTHHFKERISNEVWREVALHLPRRDLKALLFVPHPLSRIASQLLFWELDLHFAAAAPLHDPADDDDDPDAGYRRAHRRLDDGDDAAHAQRSADILTRIITDAGFASAVRTLRIYALRCDEGGTAFQTGMLANALPRLINLRNVHLSATRAGIVPVLRILQRTSPRLRGLSLKSPDGPADLAFLELHHLAHFSYATAACAGAAPTSPSTAGLHTLLAANKATLRTLALALVPTPYSPAPSPGACAPPSPALTAHWVFPASALSTRNLTRIIFTGAVPAHSTLFGEVLEHGRQLEALDIACALLSSSACSAQVRAAHAADPHALPFLRHFALTVTSLARRTTDRDLIPALAAFLRGRTGLRSLHLVVPDEGVQRAVGFDAACWGVLPSLVGLKGLKISYPPDLAPGLAAWLIPRSVLALRLTMDWASSPSSSSSSSPADIGGAGGRGRDALSFLAQLRHGVPPDLRFIGLSELPVRAPALVVEHGFPMVRVLRIGGDYWTVHRGSRSSSSSTLLSSSSSSSILSSAHAHAHPHPHPHTTAPPHRPLALAPAIRMAAGHPHSHAHTNGGGISSTGASVAAHTSSSSSPTSVMGAGRVRTSPGSNTTSIAAGGGGGGLERSGVGGSSEREREREREREWEGGGGGGMGGAGGAFELEQWPRRRALYHATEWLEWLGCEDAMIRDASAFAA
ncbi:hypothetical protein HYPSUDRAFT_59046 [Hypholoma sublateritium FD-334 SS-4]|uniref:Uncharacterized protein n=1 Tax=Hypholoma sublateritium (strain FD-334 SS-4) TaxID=945553 RepID=A0A0D2KK04_HYPSF|nr:hypothetical protein HYPSUDRAFT_59046 [Hypholoma sublateritium FD-334 SS-4]